MEDERNNAFAVSENTLSGMIGVYTERHAYISQWKLKIRFLVPEQSTLV